MKSKQRGYRKPSPNPWRNWVLLKEWNLMCQIPSSKHSKQWLRIHQRQCVGWASVRSLPRDVSSIQPWTFLNEKDVVTDTRGIIQTAQDSLLLLGSTVWNKEPASGVILIPQTELVEELSSDEPRSPGRICLQICGCFPQARFNTLGRKQAYLTIQGTQRYCIQGCAQISTSVLLQTCETQWIKEGRKRGEF